MDMYREQGWGQANVLLLPTFAIILILATACGKLAPATVPAQLAQTPGPPVMISDGVYRSTAFEVAVPVDWEVVTSPAFSSPWVVFISPEEDAVIVVAVDEADTDVMPPQPAGQTQYRVEPVRLDNGQTVYAALITSAEHNDDYESMYNALQASLNAHSLPD
jgi:hypothetical protein